MPVLSKRDFRTRSGLHSMSHPPSQESCFIPRVVCYSEIRYPVTPPTMDYVHLLLRSSSVIVLTPSELRAAYLLSLHIFTIISDTLPALHLLTSSFVNTSLRDFASELETYSFQQARLFPLAIHPIISLSLAELVSVTDRMFGATN